MLFGVDRARRLGVSNHPCQLGRQGYHEGFFAFVETAMFHLLHHQHAEHAAVVNDGYTKEGMKTLFTGGLQVMESGVTGGIFQIDRFGTLANLTDNALGRRQTDLANRFLIQPLGSTEHIALMHRVKQEDGTHLSLHRLLNAAHDQIEH